MGGNQKPKLPDAPQFQADPRVSKGIDQLFDIGTSAVNLDLTGPLAETIQTSPEMTTLFLQGLRAELNPIFAEERQKSINTLAAQGQLSGSTLPSSLADIEKRRQQEFIRQSTTMGMADINRAMQARQNIWGTGINTIGAATGFAGTDQGARNQFALQNYENQVAQAMYNAPEQTGGFGGAISGALGGGMAGFSMGGPMGAAVGALGGGAVGYFAPKGTGSGLLSGGASMAGSGWGSGQNMNTPRTTVGSGGLNKSYWNQSPSQLGF